MRYKARFAQKINAPNSLFFHEKFRYLHPSKLIRKRKINYMRKVIGIGETVLDIIFKNGKPTEAVPGGSTFNGIVSLG